MSDYVVSCGKNRDETRTFRRFEDRDAAVAAARVLVGGRLPNGDDIRFAAVSEVDGRNPPQKRYAVAALGVEPWAEAEWSPALQCWQGVVDHAAHIFDVEFAGGVRTDVVAVDPDDAVICARSLIADRAGITEYRAPVVSVRLGGKLSHVG